MDNEYWSTYVDENGKMVVRSKVNGSVRTYEDHEQEKETTLTFFWWIAVAVFIVGVLTTL